MMPPIDRLFTRDLRWSNDKFQIVRLAIDG